MNINTIPRFLLPVLALSSVSTFAADIKTFSGASCQPERSTNSYIRGSLGRMFNQDSLGRYWVCPITRDVINNNTKASGYVWAYDVNSTYANAAVKCTLSSKSATGGGLGYGYSSRSTTAYGRQKLTFAAVPIASSATGHLFMRCYIPGKTGAASSGIISYTIIEERS